MGIFDKIKGAIFGEAEAAEADPAKQPADTAPANPAPANPAPAGTAPEAAATAPKPAGAAGAEVDVAAVLDAAADRSGQTLNWRNSIVDLLKAIGLDSSLDHRKELAQELGYTGELNGSAEMNTWLHKQVIQKLKENGGKVPADL